MEQQQKLLEQYNRNRRSTSFQTGSGREVLIIPQCREPIRKIEPPSLSTLSVDDSTETRSDLFQDGQSVKKPRMVADAIRDESDSDDSLDEILNFRPFHSTDDAH